MTNVKDAVAIAGRITPSLSARARALVVAIGGLETHWGDKFHQPNGKPSNNWGAVTKGSGWTGPTFTHSDTRWNEKTQQNEHYDTEFRVYATPLAGAIDLANLLRHQYKPALAAVERGDWHAASAELYKHGYYSGKGPAAQAIADHYAALKRELLAMGISPGVVAVAIGAEWLLWAAVAWFIVRHRKGRTR